MFDLVHLTNDFNDSCSLFHLSYLNDCLRENTHRGSLFVNHIFVIIHHAFIHLLRLIVYIFNYGYYSGLMLFVQ